MKHLRPAVNFGLIGTGNIAATHARALLSMDGVRLVAVCGNNREQDRAFAQRFGCQLASGVEELVHRSDIHVVNVCTPTGLHLDHARMAALAGKHVILEKPIEITVERAQALVEVCRRAKVKLAVAMQLRFCDAYRRTRALLQEGRLGRLLHASVSMKWFRDDAYYQHGGGWRGTWELDGGGALMNQGIHCVDLLLWMVGPVKRVYGRTVNLLHPQIPVEDMALAILEFENGATGMIEASTAIRPGFPRRFEIHGERGSALIEGDALRGWNVTDPGPQDEDVIARLAPQPPGSSSVATSPVIADVSLHREVIADMIAAITEDRDPQVSGEEALKSLRVVHAVYRSHRLGEPVLIQPEEPGRIEQTAG